MRTVSACPERRATKQLPAGRIRAAGYPRPAACSRQLSVTGSPPSPGPPPAGLHLRARERNDIPAGNRCHRPSKEVC
jgi:hypothetical protein